MRSTWVFFRVKRYDSFNFSSYGRFSSPSVIFLASFGPSPCPFWIAEPELDHVQTARCWAKWGDYISISASNAPAETAQELTYLRCCSDISHSACCPPAPTGPFHQGCSPATQIQASTGLVGYVVPGPGPCTLLSFIQFLLLPACPGLSVRWHPFWCVHLTTV